MAFKQRRISRLRAMPAHEAWSALHGGGEEALVATWLELYQRTFDPERLAAARAVAEPAAAALGAKPVQPWLVSRGVAVATSTFPSTFGTATVRAHLDLEPPRVTIYEGPLTTVARAFETCGSGVDAATVRDVILAHEAFHALHPTCPGKVAEMAAHVFAGHVSGLGMFGGVVDVVHALSKGW